MSWFNLNFDWDSRVGRFLGAIAWFFLRAFIAFEADHLLYIWFRQNNSPIQAGTDVALLTFFIIAVDFARLVFSSINDDNQ